MDEEKRLEEERRRLEEEDYQRTLKKYTPNTSLSYRLKKAKVALETKKYDKEQEKIRKANEKAGVYDNLILEDDSPIMMQKSHTTVGGQSYMVMLYRVYEDRLYFKYGLTFEGEDGFSRIEEEEVTIPREEGKRFYEVECRGNTLVWDSFELRHNTKPVVAEEEWKEINPWVWGVTNKAVRVEKEYAEHNLSEDCLMYAVYDEAGYYVWNTEENALFPLCFELRDILMSAECDEEGVLVQTFTLMDTLAKMNRYNSVYCKNKGVFGYFSDNKETLIRLTELKKKELWEPGKE
ncbi:MAG: hypothetical protein IKW40_01260 [Anaerotignum sp.]|nr:hypothetical protein [Anaerotignum sp.]